MKRILTIALSIALLFTMTNGAYALDLSLIPTNNNAAPGDTVSLDLWINGLTSGGPDSLGAFDVDIAFDPSALNFTGYTLGNYLGDTNFGEAFDFSFGDLGGGLVNVSEVSFLDANSTSGPFFIPPYLDVIQPDSFSLATLDFAVGALAPGNSTAVSIDTVYALGDGFGNPLVANSTYGATITSVPDASIILLLGSSLMGLAVFSRKSKRTG